MATVKEQILNGINKYTPLLKENLKGDFVQKVSGKGLSDENFSTAFKLGKIASIKILLRISVSRYNFKIVSLPSTQVKSAKI